MKEVLEGSLTDINYKEEIKNEVFKVIFKFVNGGSVAYKVRGRLDVFNQIGELVFTGWSKEVDFCPGTDKTFELYWYPVNMTGNFTGRIRVYYGNEILENSSIKFKIKGVKKPEKALEIFNVKVYDDVIEVDVRSKKNLTDLLVIPSEYPLGWIFEQGRIESIKKDETKRISINYEPALWTSDRNTSLYLVTEDGKYFGHETFILEKENGLKKILYNSSKWLQKVLLKIYNPKK